MSLPNCEVETNNIQKLPDSPALPPNELKQCFDKAGKDLKDYINDSLIPEIEDADEEVKNIIQKQILKTYKYSVTTSVVIAENEDYTVPRNL